MIVIIFEYIKVLSCLPDEVQLSDIQKFLMTSVQNRLSEKRKYLIQKGLIKAEFLRVRLFQPLLCKYISCNVVGFK